MNNQAPMRSSQSSHTPSESMPEFDVPPEGTLPSGRNEQRYHQRMGKILNQAKLLISSPTTDQPPRLLDIGCSSGALLRVAKACAYDAVVKVTREILAIPARWSDKGHDMLATLKKPEQ